MLDGLVMLSDLVILMGGLVLLDGLVMLDGLVRLGGLVILKWTPWVFIQPLSLEGKGELGTRVLSVSGRLVRLGPRLHVWDPWSVGAWMSSS